MGAKGTTATLPIPLLQEIVLLPPAPPAPAWRQPRDGSHGRLPGPSAPRRAEPRAVLTPISAFLRTALARRFPRPSRLQEDALRHRSYRWFWPPARQHIRGVERGEFGAQFPRQNGLPSCGARWQAAALPLPPPGLPACQPVLHWNSCPVCVNLRSRCLPQPENSPLNVGMAPASWRNSYYAPDASTPWTMQFYDYEGSLNVPQISPTDSTLNE